MPQLVYDTRAERGCFYWYERGGTSGGRRVSFETGLRQLDARDHYSNFVRFRAIKRENFNGPQKYMFLCMYVVLAVKRAVVCPSSLSSSGPNNSVASE